MSTLTADLKNLVGEPVEKAELWITAPSIKRDGALVAGSLVKEPFDRYGRVSVELLDTDTAGTDPVSWQYGFQVKWRGGSLSKFYATITEDIDLSELQPVDPAGPQYVPVSAAIDDVQGLPEALSTKVSQQALTDALATKVDQTALTEGLATKWNVPTAQGATADLGTALAALGLRAPGAAYPITTSGTVVFTGQFRTTVTSRTAAAALTTSNPEVQLCNATSAAFTVTLPSTSTAGIRFTIKKTDASANAVTVAGTIDGTPNYVLPVQNKYVTVISSGTSGAWYLINNN